MHDLGIRSYKRIRKEKRQTQKGIEDAVSFYMDMTVEVSSTISFGLGSILIAVVKFLLNSVLFVLKAVLYGAKLHQFSLRHTQSQQNR